MAGGFTLVIGAMDLTEYTRVNPGDGLDPYPAGAIEPVFSESPLRDGGRFAHFNRKLTERRIPLFLSEPDVTVLRTLEIDLNRELNRAPGIQAEWRPPTSGDSTYWDVEAGVFEPEWNFRRDQRGYMAGVLRLWTGPYGTTATERIVATAVASGVLTQVAIPSALAGDAPALLDVRVTAGDTVPSVGRRVAFAVLPHPSYSARFPAASIGDRQAGAALVGLAGADGSQYLGLPVSPTGASGVAAMVPLTIPTVYAGRNRVFALARSRLNGGVNLRMFDPFGNALGPTTVATVQEGMGLLDMGVLNVPEGQVPTTYKLPIVGGGASGNTIAASPGLQLNAVFVLPEANTIMVNDLGAVATTLAGDDFSADKDEMSGQPDDYGNTWKLARNVIARLGILDGQVYSIGTHAGHYVNRLVQDCDTAVAFAVNAAASGGKALVRRDVTSNTYIDAIYEHSPSRTLSLFSVAAGVTTLHASQALASLASIDRHQLKLRTLGGQAIVNLRRVDGATIFLPGPAGVLAASIGASHANLNQAGNPGISLRGVVASDVSVSFWPPFTVQSIPSSALAARDVYRFTVDDQITRNPSGFDITARLEGAARGAMPKAPAPTCARVAALIAPVDQGVANDLLAVEVRALERFRFSR